MKKALTVECPHCGSKPGYDCLSVNGVAVPPHVSRLNAAVAETKDAKSERTKVHAARKGGGLAELSKAIMEAGEHSREKRAADEKRRARQHKDCPCHGGPCQEHAKGGRLCGVGVCVLMN